MRNSYYSVFQEPWWLDATAPGQWEEVSIGSGRTPEARLPFVVKQEGRIRTLTQPALTQTLGPWIKDTTTNYAKSLGRANKLYAELIEQLPSHDVFYQNFAPEVVNWLPFYWAGFNQTTRYTYRFDLTLPESELWSSMDKRNRSQYRKAKSRLVAAQEDDLDTFLALNRSTFARQGLEVPYSDDLVRRIDSAAQKNADRSIIICRDQTTGEPHAGIYMVHYGRITHSLMSGANEELREQNGMIVARWKAIEVSKKVSDILDLQGSMMRTVERRNRNYGAIQVPLMTISRKNQVAVRRETVSAARQKMVRSGRGMANKLAGIARRKVG